MTKPRTPLLLTFLVCFSYQTHGAESSNSAFPRNDLQTVQFEQFFGSETQDTLSLAGQFPAWWAYASLPGFTVGPVGAFVALEVDGMYRWAKIGNEAIMERPLHRIGIFGGVNIIDREKHRGSILAGTGVAGDFTFIATRNLYLHLIYEHRFVLSEKLTLGMGILVMNNFGVWQAPPNLLPYLSWFPAPQWLLKIGWDNVELKRAFGEKLALVGEARYDMSFFRLDRHRSYELETVAVGGGCDIHLTGDMYLRFRYKEMVLRNERLADDHRDSPSRIRDNRGRSVRLILVRAK